MKLQQALDIVRGDVVAFIGAGGIPREHMRYLIAPGGSFDYVSGCPLDTPSGSMSGSYRMVDEDGNAFDVTIPRFHLLSSVN